MSFDCVLKNGRLVTSRIDSVCDIGIKDGKVAAINPDGLRMDGGAEVDCSGKLVLPGFIDLHVHFNDPGFTHREDFLSGTSAAAAGGVILVADMPLANEPVTISAMAFTEKLQQAQSKAVIDFALWGGLVGDNSDELASMHGLGACGFKAFTCFAGESYPLSTDSTLLKGLSEAKKLGSYIGVHCEEESLIQAFDKLDAYEKEGGINHFLQAHNPAVERVATEKALAIARAANAHVHICHASHPEIVQLVADSALAGVKATVETCPQYLVFTTDDLRQIGGELKCTPPVRDRMSVEGMWKMLADGKIDFLVSDHSPATREEKVGPPFHELWGGINGIQFLFNVLYSEGVCQRDFPLQQLVELYSGAPARFAGLYPEYGDIRVGGPGSFVIFDPDAEHVVADHNLLTKNKQSPYLGMTLKGRVESTWIRGKPVYEIKEDVQKIEVSGGYGRFVKFARNGEVSK